MVDVKSIVSYGGVVEMNDEEWEVFMEENKLRNKIFKLEWELKELEELKKRKEKELDSFIGVLGNIVLYKRYLRVLRGIIKRMKKESGKNEKCKEV